MLSSRIAQNVPLTRAISCTPLVVSKFFELLKGTLESLRLQDSPGSIWNCDESGFQCDPNSQKIICKRGSKKPIQLSANGERATYNVLNCCSAKGDYLPPLILYAAKNLYANWTEGGPKDTSYNVT